MKIHTLPLKRKRVPQHMLDRAEEKRKLREATRETRCIYCGAAFAFVPIYPGISQPYDTAICRKLHEAETQSDSGSGVEGNNDG